MLKVSAVTLRPNQMLNSLNIRNSRKRIKIFLKLALPRTKIIKTYTLNLKLSISISKISLTKYTEDAMKLEERKSPYDDPFVFLAGVINEKIKVLDYDLSSLDNNVIVMEILDAAIRSAESGKTIYLD